MPELAFAEEALNAARALLLLDLRTQWSYLLFLIKLFLKVWLSNNIIAIVLRRASFGKIVAEKCGINATSLA